MGGIRNRTKSKIDNKIPLENLTDALSSLVVSNVFEKQELIEEENVQQRAERIIKFLETRIEIISITSKKRNEIIEKRNLN